MTEEENRDRDIDEEFDETAPVDVVPETEPVVESTEASPEQPRPESRPEQRAAPKKEPEPLTAEATTEGEDEGERSLSPVERLRRKLAELRELRRKHDDLIHDLMRDIRDFRADLKREKLQGKDRLARIAQFVAEHKGTEAGQALTKILRPLERAAAKTGREKLNDIVTMGVKFRAWDDSLFTVEYGKRWGRDVVEWFATRENELESAIEEASSDQEQRAA